MCLLSGVSGLGQELLGPARAVIIAYEVGIIAQHARGKNTLCRDTAYPFA